MRRILLLSALLMLGFAPAPFRKPVAKKLDPQVIAAWQNAGCEIGWYGRTRDGGWQYTTGKPEDDNALAALWWNPQIDPVSLRKLPAPNAPVGLFLGSAPSLPQLTDAGMKEIARFKTVRHLAISGTRVTDTGLKELLEIKDSLQGLVLGSLDISDEGLKSVGKLLGLRYLMLGNSPKVTDTGVKELTRLTNLHTLGLTNTKVTDASLKVIAGFRGLEELHLGLTAVTDEGLKELHGLIHLKYLSLPRTGVTKEGVAQLQKALPKVKIRR
jgi:hypothetical protein